VVPCIYKLIKYVLLQVNFIHLLIADSVEEKPLNSFINCEIKAIYEKKSLYSVCSIFEPILVIHFTSLEGKRRKGEPCYTLIFRS